MASNILQQFMDEHGITPSKLREISGISERTIYSIRKKFINGKIATQKQIVDALSTLTKSTVTAKDIFQI